MDQRPVEVRLARVHDSGVKERLRTSGVLEQLDEDRIVPHIEQAVQASLAP